MVHAPLLRNFYLSGGHTRSQCKHRLAKPCLSCELVCTHLTALLWYLCLLSIMQSNASHGMAVIVECRGTVAGHASKCE